MKILTAISPTTREISSPNASYAGLKSAHIRFRKSKRFGATSTRYRFWNVKNVEARRSVGREKSDGGRRKMTAKELEQIFWLNREIVMWNKELEKLRCKSLISSPRWDSAPCSGSGTSDKVCDTAVDTTTIERIIEGKRAEITIQKERIIRFIVNIDNSLMRQIVYSRCVSCMRWNDVADTIGGNNTENSVKQAYHRFLKDELPKLVTHVTPTCDKL